MNKKLAVFFPGRKYDVDCPLLYYSDFICKSKGYDTLYLHYAAHRDEETNTTVREDIENAKSYVIERLNQSNLNHYEEILFISKSIGTVLAAYAQTEKNLTVRNIFFTPLEDTLPYFSNHRLKRAEKHLVIAGTNDSFLNADKLKEVCEREQMVLFQFEGLGHRMESQEIADTLDIMKKIMGLVENFIVKKDEI